ncbi:MAG: hypothetical protein ACE5EO_12765, partial [Candidatus Krumholzibacteriia bacterium]
MRARYKVPVLACIVLCVVVGAAAFSPAATSVVRLPLKGRAMVRSLHERGIDILTLNRDGTIDVAADEKQVEYLFSLGLPASVIVTPEMASAAVALDANLGLYHTYAEMD